MLPALAGHMSEMQALGRRNFATAASSSAASHQMTGALTAGREPQSCALTAGRAKRSLPILHQWEAGASASIMLVGVGCLAFFAGSLPSK